MQFQSSQETQTTFNLASRNDVTHSGREATRLVNRFRVIINRNHFRTDSGNLAFPMTVIILLHRKNRQRLGSRLRAVLLLLAPPVGACGWNYHRPLEAPPGGFFNLTLDFCTSRSSIWAPENTAKWRRRRNGSLCKTEQLSRQFFKTSPEKRSQSKNLNS